MAGPRLPNPHIAAALLLWIGAVMPCAANAADLDGTKWTLATLGGRPPVARSSITLEFEGRRLQGSDGCNRYSGPYSAAGSQLMIGPDVVSTMMGCRAALMEQAGAFMNFLLGTKSYRTVGGELQLLDAHENVRVAFTAQSRSLSDV